MKIQIGLDIDNFWTFRKDMVSKNIEDVIWHTVVDFENLQRLSFYLVSAINYPEIIAELIFVERFIHPHLLQSMRGLLYRTVFACTEKLITCNIIVEE